MDGHEWVIDEEDDGEKFRTVLWAHGGDNFGAYEQSIYEDGVGARRELADDRILELFAAELLRLAEDNKRLRDTIDSIENVVVRLDNSDYNLPAQGLIDRIMTIISQATHHDGATSS